MNPKFCPNCGTPVEGSGSFCKSCGNSLMPRETEDMFRKESPATVPDAEKESAVIRAARRLLEKGEYTIWSGKANLYRHMMNAAGGQLILTNRRFLFVDHGFNLFLKAKPEEESIYFHEIADVKARTVMLVSRRLRVEKKDGTHQEYIVWNPEKWMEAVRQAMPHI